VRPAAWPGSPSPPASSAESPSLRPTAPPCSLSVSLRLGRPVVTPASPAGEAGARARRGLLRSCSISRTRPVRTFAPHAPRGLGGDPSPGRSPALQRLVWGRGNAPTGLSPGPVPAVGRQGGVACAS
jgi:hypothetical protein